MNRIRKIIIYLLKIQIIVYIIKKREIKNAKKKFIFNLNFEAKIENETISNSNFYEKNRRPIIFGGILGGVFIIYKLHKIKIEKIQREIKEEYEKKQRQIELEDLKKECENQRIEKERKKKRIETLKELKNQKLAKKLEELEELEDLKKNSKIKKRNRSRNRRNRI